MHCNLSSTKDCSTNNKGSLPLNNALQYIRNARHFVLQRLFLIFSTSMYASHRNNNKLWAKNLKQRASAKFSGSYKKVYSNNTDRGHHDRIPTLQASQTVSLVSEQFFTTPSPISQGVQGKHTRRSLLKNWPSLHLHTVSWVLLQALCTSLLPVHSLHLRHLSLNVGRSM